ncbi:glycoside hydrolase [Pedobacter sp. G11]|uniref:MGH1-like glycoside hydrolase domain-containing protein n=1 Tax=Pedobacter sp. G11 TaxID=2482728 RepID=UPI000F5FF82A|nr:glycoside hydrolase [Pedobacter sp. G11]AZI26385.1 glycoside hydrolase [Pedobacter sp. G11]
MKIFKQTACIALLLISNLLRAQQPAISFQHLSDLNHSHDIGLGNWGPYSKKYAGISHIPQLSTGVRFDFFIVPGYYRNKIMVPNVLFESGYFPWFADAKTGRYAYRYELEWKDRVYTDVNYQVLDDRTVMAEIRCVNNTGMPQALAINLMGALSLPESWPNKKLDKPAQSIWINAVDYHSLSFAEKHPRDNLVTDGLMNGEVRGAEFLETSALGKRFSQSAGNEVSYRVPDKFSKGFLQIIFKGNVKSVTRLSSDAVSGKEITLIGTGALEIISLPFDVGGNKTLKLKSLGGDGMEINGILFSTKGDLPVKIEDNDRSEVPQVVTSVAKKRVLLKYKHAEGFYGLTWEDALFKIREIKSDDLDVYFRKMVHNHVDSILRGNERGHFENVFIRPVELNAHSEKVLRCLITYGKDKVQVDQTLDNFEILKKKNPAPEHERDNYLTGAQPYAFSNKMLKAALLENIVYPIYTQRNYIRHYTPGKWWNSLYTWDSGFIALGLNEFDRERATECINAYTTAEGSQSAFIHHGSPVPVQVYAFMDLWNKTQSKALASYFYPRFKRYYEFLSGKQGSSTTGSLSSGLLKTWDYFYNSGGWDDYPAQSGVHQGRLEASVAPVITTAQCIRFAKILRMMARETGHLSDLGAYDRDVDVFSNALQQHAWNPVSGYYSYVKHDPSGKPSGPFTYADGIDYNMGLDGAYPLLAGICNAAQQKELLKKIFSPAHMWTASGLGVVDQSAPYYRKDGYWNGSVWMPHQWFIWKTMLDIGRPELAMQIARTGLEVFKKETDSSYYTFEHYLSGTGRGAGWHQFSGLSTPVLSWYNAYYKKGTVTTGFEILLTKSEFNADLSGYRADLSFDDSTKAHARSMLICLNPSNKYMASFNGASLKIEESYPGLLYVKLPVSNDKGKLIIKSR